MADPCFVTGTGLDHEYTDWSLVVRPVAPLQSWRLPAHRTVKRRQTPNRTYKVRWPRQQRRHTLALMQTCLVVVSAPWGAASKKLVWHAKYIVIVYRSLLRPLIA